MIKQQDPANQLLRQPRLQQTMLGARLQPSWHRVQYIRSEQGGSADGPTAPGPPSRRKSGAATSGAPRLPKPQQVPIGAGGAPRCAR